MRHPPFTSVFLQTVEVQHHKAIEDGVRLTAPAAGLALVHFRLALIDVSLHVTRHEHEHGQLPLHLVGLVYVTRLDGSTYLLYDCTDVVVVGDFEEFFEVARNARRIVCLLIVKH